MVRGSMLKIVLLTALVIPLLALNLAGAFATESRLIEEIMVTAQRVEESANKVPISLTAFNEAMIKDRQIIGLADLHINIPNVTFTPRQSQSAGIMQIRGIGLAALSTGVETPSATHINEIPFPQLYAGIEIFDLERIELMRGPQGTLFGRNATAGALNLITKRPSFESISGYAELEYGDYDNKRFTGALNVPVTDALAVRIAAMTLERDGYIENKAGGQIPGVRHPVHDLLGCVPGWVGARYHASEETRPTGPLGDVGRARLGRRRRELGLRGRGVGGRIFVPCLGRKGSL